MSLPHIHTGIVAVIASKQVMSDERVSSMFQKKKKKKKKNNKNNSIAFVKSNAYLYIFSFVFIFLYPLLYACTTLFLILQTIFVLTLKLCAAASQFPRLMAFNIYS